MAAAAQGTEAQKERFIREVPLLARLPPEDVRALASTARLRAYPAGTVIIREGDPGDSLHVVVEGQVRITVGSPTGEEATVAVMGQGDFFGDFALLDGRPRSASVLAALPTRTLVVTRDAFVSWISQRPTAALALLETLSLRLRRTDEQLADMVFLDLPQRLAKQLRVLASTAADADGRIAITQAELAMMLGVSRESVNKQLNAFAREGWIRLGRGAVFVLDPESLQRFV